MNGIAKIVSSLLLASFLFSHCEVFSIVALYVGKPAGQTCVNPDCYCEHDGPGGNKAICGMCTTSSANPKVLPNDQCCLYQANCDPTSGRPVLAVNKDLQPVKTMNRNFNFANVVIFRLLESKILTFDFKAAIFHPPQV